MFAELCRLALTHRTPHFHFPPTPLPVFIRVAVSLSSFTHTHSTTTTTHTHFPGGTTENWHNGALRVLARTLPRAHRMGSVHCGDLRATTTESPHPPWGVGKKGRTNHPPTVLVWCCTGSGAPLLWPRPPPPSPVLFAFVPCEQQQPNYLYSTTSDEYGTVV
jgi:hypothetical protein